MDMERTYPVVIECPRTRREVDTGFVLTEAAFARLALRQAFVSCPHCAEYHAYEMAEARLKFGAGVMRPVRVARFHRHPYRRNHHR